MAEIGRNCPVESVTASSDMRTPGPRDRGRWPPTPHVDYHDDQRVPNVRVATRHPSTPPPCLSQHGPGDVAHAKLCL